MNFNFITKPLRRLQTFVSCWKSAICLNKIELTKIEKTRIKENMKWYPLDSFGYNRLNLGIAICNFKIELLKALGGIEMEKLSEITKHKYAVCVFCNKIYIDDLHDDKCDVFCKNCGARLSRNLSCKQVSVMQLWQGSYVKTTYPIMKEKIYG